jgi:hypothetical protein
MSNINSEIDDIIDQLKDDSINTQSNNSQQQPTITNNTQIKPSTLTDDNVNDYVYHKSSELVESTLGAIHSLRDNILAGSDPKEIAALSQLINSASKALDQLNKINLQNKQAKSNVEIKKMELESNSHLSKLIPQTNNIVIATRDEIMEKMFDKQPKREKLQIIDSEIVK